MFNRLLRPPKKLSFFLFGPRQTGKTTLVRSLVGKSGVWSVNLLLGDTYFRYLKDPALFRREAEHQIAQNHINTIFVDEVQRIPDLLNEIQELMLATHCRFILTGSSARKLKRGMGNLLAGRAVERTLYPYDRKGVGRGVQFGGRVAIWRASPGGHGPR